jgi:hypothetical protein
MYTTTLALGPICVQAAEKETEEIIIKKYVVLNFSLEYTKYVAK